MSYAFLVWAAPGTGKTTFALSGEGRKWYAELDAGSYSRAVAGMPLAEGEVEVHKFYVPLTSLLDIARIDTAMVGQSGKGPVQFVHNLKGWNEKYTEFLATYLEALDTDCRYIVIDTSTRLWEMARNASMQRIQQTRPADQWSANMRTPEYQEANDQIAQIVEAAKMYDKHLILIAHQKEIWANGDATGKFQADGSKHIPAMMDMVLRFAIVDKLPVATIEKGPLALTEMRLVAPTLPEVIDLLDSAAAIQRAGLEMPTTPDEVIALAKVLA